MSGNTQSDNSAKNYSKDDAQKSSYEGQDDSSNYYDGIGRDAASGEIKEKSDEPKSKTFNEDEESWENDKGTGGSPSEAGSGADYGSRTESDSEGQEGNTENSQQRSSFTNDDEEKRRRESTSEGGFDNSNDTF